jgi:NAD(P)-dependent dehydrogenase (short-subunit alcohol dehydrogenase family)
MDLHNQDMFSLQGKVIVVTGGTGVLGSSFVEAIAGAKGIVIVIGRNQEKCNKKALEIINAGGEALGVYANVLLEDDLIAAREIILKKYGKIDGLVNAAGGNIPNAVVQKDADIFSLDLEAQKEALNINLWGTLLPTQIFGKAMAAQGKGSIVNISSVSSKRALTKVLGYSLGKAGIDCYTQWFGTELAKRFGDKIRMNALMPGFFLTEQNRNLLTNSDGSLTERGQLITKNTPFNRFGNPSELYGALIYLLSDASSFVTGTEIRVDGGFNSFSGV